MTVLKFSTGEAVDPPCDTEPARTLKDFPWDMNLGKPYGDINGTNDLARYKEDKVNSPAHYMHLGGVECITITEHMSFCLGNVVKYVYRCNLKGGVEDLKKARWYLDREIARREKAVTPDSDDYHGC
jgi:hypothetical protein